MITLLYEFFDRCNKASLVPSEKHIDAFLMEKDAMHYRTHFIKFCFYSWENALQTLGKIKRIDNYRVL